MQVFFHRYNLFFSGDEAIMGTHCFKGHHDGSRISYFPSSKRGANVVIIKLRKVRNGVFEKSPDSYLESYEISD